MKCQCPNRVEKTDPFWGRTCCCGKGTAILEVIRNGKQTFLCSRCDTSSDKDKKLVKNPDWEALNREDSFGYLAIKDNPRFERGD